MMTPAFWARDGTVPKLLTPMGALFHFGGLIRRRLARSVRLDIPVLCVGNLVTGGAGKTPVALAIGERLKQQDRAVAFLTRGYGSRLRGPILVDPTRHDADDVGDEALLLAEVAPTWIARNRALGAAAARRRGADTIVMDDGFQNPGLVKTCSMVVIDGDYGFGNRRIVPAGPLRESINGGLARADAVVIVGADRASVTAILPPHLPVLTATLDPLPDDNLRPGRSVFGFAGIGRPEKFRNSLQALGLRIAGFAAFADHYKYSEPDLDDLLATAARLGGIPVTTAKDHVRLPRRFRDAVRRLDVAICWQNTSGLTRLLDECLASGAD